MAERDEHGRFLPGHKGGPGRPPKEKTISDNLRVRLGETVEVEEKRGRKTVKVKKTYLELFVESQIKRAINGDPSAAKNVWDRIEGRVSLPIANDGERPFVIMIDREMDGI